MLTVLVTAVNAVQPRVWQVMQFVALLILVGYGAHLVIAGHQDAGSALIAGSFALLKFEVGGPAQS